MRKFSLKGKNENKGHIYISYFVLTSVLTNYAFHKGLNIYLNEIHNREKEYLQKEKLVVQTKTERFNL